MGKATENWRRPGENFYGLKWAGRHKDGASKFRGTWRKGPPLWFSRMFLTMAVVFGCAGLGLGFFALVGNVALLVPAIVLGSVSAIYTLVSLISYRQRDKFLRLQEPSAVAEELGIPQEELGRLVEERDIKPDLYFNDVPLYDPNKLVAAKVLLRASEQPVSNDTLLRAASPAPSMTETEQLLRASTTE